MNVCQFCGQPSRLLCDGRIWALANGKRFRVPLAWPCEPNTKTASCDAHVCRACAKKVSDIHIRTNKGCRWNTRDLCPACQKVEKVPVEIEGSAA